MSFAVVLRKIASETSRFLILNPVGFVACGLILGILASWGAEIPVSWWIVSFVVPVILGAFYGQEERVLSNRLIGDNLRIRCRSDSLQLAIHFGI